MKRFNINENIALEASAGSGKTFTLTLRYLKILYSNYKSYQKAFPNKILAITFTKKAAKEMKERIISTIESIVKNEFEDFVKDIIDTKSSHDDFVKNFYKIYEEIIENLSNLKIRTIDSLINEILFSFPFDNSLGLNCSIIDSFKNQELIEESLRLFLDKEKSQSNRSILLYQLQEDSLDRVLKNINSLIENRNIFESFDLKIEIDFDEQIESLKSREKNLIEQLKIFYTDIIETLGDSFKKGRSKELEKFRDNRHFDFEKTVDIFLKSEDLSKTNLLSSALFKKNLLDGKNELFFSLQNEILEYFDERYKLNFLQKIYFGKEILRFYDKIKAQNKALTFNDITSYANKLLNNYTPSDEIISEYFYFILNQRYSHILIDEFQDTSIQQWLILRPIVEEIVASKDKNKSFFYVGDKKQAIYSWRGGEAKLFDDVMMKFDEKYNNLSKDFLEYNFRSSKNIVAFVNNCFYQNTLEWEKNGFLASASYDTYLPQEIPEKNQGKLGLVEYNKILLKENQKAENLEYQLIIERIKELINIGMNPAEIAILVNSNSEVNNYAYYLEKEKISFHIGTNISIMDREEIKCIFYFLQYIFDQKNKLIFLNLLRTPIFAYSDDEIENWESLEKEIFTEDLLNKLLEYNFVEKIRYILDKYNVFKIFNASREKSNIYRFLEISNNFFRNNGNDLKNFINYCKENRDSDTFFQKADAKSDALTIITLHKSKGLEFPTVFYLTNADLARRGNKKDLYWKFDQNWLVSNIFDFQDIKKIINLSNNQLHRIGLENIKKFYSDYLQKELQEYLNTLYVAFTRAKNNLFIYHTEKGNFAKNLSAFLEKSFDDVYVEQSENEKSIIEKYTFEPENAKLLFEEKSEEISIEKCEIQSSSLLNSFNENISEIKIEHMSLTDIENKVLGEAVHDFFEQVTDFSQNNFDLEKEIIKNKWHSRMGKALWEKFQHKIAFFFDYLKKEKSLQKILYNNDFLSEAELIDPEEFALVRMDRIIFNNDEIYILDYKTVENTEKDFEEYHLQLRKYKRILSKQKNEKFRGKLIKTFLLLIGNEEIKLLEVN